MTTAAPDVAAADASPPTYEVYGTPIASAYPFEFPLPASDRPAELTFSLVAEPPVRHRFDTDQACYVVDDSWGPAAIACHRYDDHVVVRFRGVSDVYVWDDRITACLLSPGLERIVEIQFLGMIMALWLELRGVVPLHGSAVARDGRGLVFLGENGAGKTMTAVAFAQQGWRLLSDDLVALRPSDGPPAISAAYPQIRLWPADAARVVDQPMDLDIVHPDFDKLRLPLDGAGLGEFTSEPASLDTIYLLDRPRDDIRAPRLESVPAGTAIFELLRHVFVAEMSEALGAGGNRLHALAGIVAQVPVVRIHRPRQEPPAADEVVDLLSGEQA